MGKVCFLRVALAEKADLWLCKPKIICRKGQFMNKMEFLVQLEEELCRQALEPVSVRRQRVGRNNGQETLCLSLLPRGRRVSPAIPVEGYYRKWREGSSARELAEEFLAEWRRADREQGLEDLAFGDYGKVKRGIYLMAVSRERNRWALENQPWKPFLDLALVCYYRVDQRLIPEAMVRIEKSHLKLWGVTEEELFCQAEENGNRDLRPKLYSMGELLGAGEGEPALYVLTNENRYLGAGAIADQRLMEKVGRQLKSDFYVLPSSIHECLILPDYGKFSREALQDLVREVNETQVDSAEVLSDEVYLYSRSAGRLTM